jgi:UDPglucose 6-dehydrogenase
MNKEKIGVIGLGNLGLPLAVTFAKSDFDVIAMDVDDNKIKKLEGHISPFEETGLQDALLEPKVKTNLHPTTNLEAAILETKASFIVVNTPSRPDGSFSLKYLRMAAENIGKILKKADFFHVVVVVSTVSPKDCEDHILPILESQSGKKCGIDFGFVHNPEFIALGSVIKDMLHPDYRVIGESDPKSGRIIEEIYKQVSDDPIVRMSIANAELTKIALNCYMTLKISFVNTLSEICQNMDGGNVDLVTKTLGLDSRISPKFLKAGLGFGGPCFPRDNQAFMAIAKKFDAQAFLSEATVKVNDRQISLILERIKKAPNVKHITILGVSYKPDVPYIIESQAFEVAKLLAEDPEYQVTLYDPQAMENSRKILGNKVNYATSVDDALNSQSDLYVILTPWKEFDNLNFEGKRVINFWRVT